MTVEIIIGDARKKLLGMPDGSVQCCVTSPPYFGLRDYGVDGQMGLEDTPDEFVAGMVAVFREVRRVLRDDGTLWLNIGDSYAGSWGAQGHGSSPSSAMSRHQIRNHPQKLTQTGAIKGAGIKAKDLIGIPWMLAFALRADGWYLRQEVIWHKPNPMPESVRDRCTKSHESLFLLSKRPQYYFDAEAIAEDRVSDEDANGFRGGCYVSGEIDNGGLGKRKAVGNKRVRGLPPRHAQYLESSDQSGLDSVGRGQGRNKRSVWSVATQPFGEAHFATFPPALIEPCILAGCPVGGTVLDPFGGAGTTGLVAERLGRNAMLIELNPDYAEMARRRIRADLGRVQSDMPDRHDDAGPLFGSAAA